jgi:MoaA/NifB/PqqE/SkfB family radical SAM enzyme
MDEADKRKLQRETAWRLGLVAKNALVMSDVLATHALRITPHYIPIILLFITYRCNLRCRTCGVCLLEEEVRSTPELTLDEWKAVIRSAVRMRTIIIVISGGEPLLRPDVLIDLLQYTCDQGISVHLCTNGVLIDKDYAVRIGKTGVHTISVSLESPEPEIHERIRGPGTFERALNGIRLLRQFAPSVRIGINHVITAENFRCMADMVPFAESLGVHQIKFAPIHTNLLHKRKGISQYGSLVFEPKDIEELQVELIRLRAALGRSRLLTTSPMFLAKIADLYSDPPRFRCFAGYAATAIDPVGMVSPCSDMNGVACVRDKPLEEIWRSPEFREARNHVRHCNSPCWDTANAELSIRLRFSSLVGDLVQTWKDMGFYFGKDR